MKNLIQQTFLTLLALPIYSSDIDTLTIKSKITEATVYFQGATIQREIKVSNSGEFVLAVKGIPKSIDTRSITVESDSQIEIKSVKSDYRLPEISKPPTEIVDDTEFSKLADSIELVKILVEVLDAEYDMIKKNNNFENDEEITSVEEVILASKFYQTRVKELRLERLELRRALEKLQLRTDTIDKKIKEYEEAKNKSELNIYVHLNAKSKDAKLKLSYYIPNASWSPYYDLKAGKAHKKLQLYRKAFVKQSTMEDWENIKLILSTATPSNDNSLPYLNPQRLYHTDTRSKIDYNNITKNKSGNTGRIVDAEGLPIIGATVIIIGTNQGTTTDVDGQFYLPEGIDKNISVSYTGYSTVSCRLNNQYNVITLDEGVLLNEIVVTGLGGRRQKRAKKEKVVQVRKQVNLEIKETLNTLSYKLKERYSIKSDSEPIDVLLIKEDLPSELTYTSIPSENEAAYLLAEIKEWHLYNLEPAQVNLFIDGTYKGKTTINPNTQDDKLKISLGNDPEISVSRQWVNNKYKKKFLNRHKEEVHQFALTIKNNKSGPITIKVRDQLPISSDEAIDIEPQNLSGGHLEEDTGFVDWTLQLASGESKELRLSYKLKYPKHYDLKI